MRADADTGLRDYVSSYSGIIEALTSYTDEGLSDSSI